MLLLILSMEITILAAQTNRPWVTKASKPNSVTQGLRGHHLSIWPSHGRYYNFKNGGWEWQRPQIYGTAEDVFTQTIVIPYIVPMLENAGANVFVARERDWQTEECIVDNDMASSGYMERPGGESWSNAPRPGFGITKGVYRDGDRPFAKGSARMIRSAQNSEISKAYYRPNISKSGSYAVYVSYQTIEGSVNDAEYIVVHQGQQTKFRVNQQMGSGTWVYLGTFDFDAHSTFENYVMVTNNSSHRGGFITTDAVRFGGGMGNTERGGRISNVPRAMECSRYWTQYAGGPRAAVCSKGGQDDYGDDINTRSLMSNWLSYGSSTNPTDKSASSNVAEMDTTTMAEAAAKAYRESMISQNPDLDSIGFARIDSIANAIADSVARVPVAQINVLKGKTLTGHVPLELQLGVHSDAGFHRDFKSIFGTLTICTSDFNDKKLATGQPRGKSFDFACELLYNVSREIQKSFGNWEARDVWDKNYSETRLPAQPSAILETMSHESFPDMKLGHDPYFKFIFGRAVYKTILKYIARQSGKKAVVQPLAPNSFAASRLRGNVLTLSWKHTEDPNEQTAVSDSYNVYTRVGDRGYDNGVNVKSNEYTIPLKPNKIYRFRVTAVNAGGESFPTEELVAMYNPQAKETVMIVNAFHRLSSPEVIDTDSLCGFDLDSDVGLSYGKTPAWVGHQVCFDKSKAGRSHGLGHTNNDLLGRFTAGNDFNYAYSHAEAISKAGDYNIVSLSSEDFSTATKTDNIAMLDILLGNEKNDGHSLLPYKTFTPSVRHAISAYANCGGRLLVSGSYTASDMQQADEQEWMAKNLHVAYGGCDRDSLAFRTDSLTDMISCGDIAFSTYRHVNADHYASVASDIIIPADSTLALTQMPMMRYASGNSAAVAYSDDKLRSVTMGFPFECIKEPADRKALMQRIISYLFNKE